MGPIFQNGDQVVRKTEQGEVGKVLGSPHTRTADTYYTDYTYYTDDEWATLCMEQHAGSLTATPLDMPTPDTWLPGMAGAVCVGTPAGRLRTCTAATDTMTDGPESVATTMGVEAIQVATPLGWCDIWLGDDMTSDIRTETPPTGSPLSRSPLTETSPTCSH